MKTNNVEDPGICDWCERPACSALGPLPGGERSCHTHRREMRVPVGADGASYPSWAWRDGRWHAE